MKGMLDMLFNKEKDNRKEGRWKEFNKHGVLISVGNYHDDLKHGQWFEYYDTGELVLEENYQHGIPHGRYATYHLNGTLFSEGNYVNGNREGYFLVYDEAGRQIKSLLFSEDKLVEEVEVPLEDMIHYK